MRGDGGCAAKVESPSSAAAYNCVDHGTMRLPGSAKLLDPAHPSARAVRLVDAPFRRSSATEHQMATVLDSWVLPIMDGVVYGAAGSRVRKSFVSRLDQLPFPSGPVGRRGRSAFEPQESSKSRIHEIRGRSTTSTRSSRPPLSRSSTPSYRLREGRRREIPLRPRTPGRIWSLMLRRRDPARHRCLRERRACRGRGPHPRATPRSRSPRQR